MPSGFKIADAHVEVHLERSQLDDDLAKLPGELNPAVDRIGRDAGTRLGRGIGDGVDGGSVARTIGDDVDKELQPRVQRSGSDSGDKLSQGMRLAVIRNSPLIVAGIGAALAAGAPLMMAGATVLFAGLAAAGASASEDLQSTWGATSSEIFTTFQQAAAVTVPFFQQALHRLADAVVGLGPQFHSMFAAMAVPIDSLTTGIIRMAQNAMPGLVAAVKASGPVFQGLANFLGDIGTGLSQFFSIISEHAPAAGQVFSALGSIIGSLLPILGQLVGAGTELASTVLPPLASVLHVVADALNLIAPILPGVAAGFLAFKAVGMLTGPLGLLSAKLQTVAADASGVTGKLSGMGAQGVSKLQASLPALGLIIGEVSYAFEGAAQQTEDWAKALLDGGRAAAQAQTQMSQTWEYVKANTGAGNTSAWQAAWSSLKGAIFGTGATAGFAAVSVADTTQKMKDQTAVMSPLEQKQQEVTKATNDLQLAIQKYGPNSDQAASASANLKSKQDALTTAQGELERATKDVTAAIADQAAQVLASTDSNFALQRSVLQTREAELQMKDAIKQNGAGTEEAQKATLEFNQALLDQAEAAGKAAVDASGLTDKTQQQTLSNQVVLKSLLDLKQQYGSEFPGALDTTIATLEASGVALDNVGAKKPTPTVNLNDGPFQGILNYVNGAINALGGKAPTPTAFMNDQPFNGAAASMNSMLSYLAGRNVTPSASLIANTLNAENSLDYAARNRISYVTQIYRPGGNNSAYAAATGGNIGKIIAGAAKRFDVGGKVSGPGGPRDDLIPAMSYGGAPLRLSNDEWVIPGAPSNRYGDAKMAAIVAGTATVTLPGPRPAPTLTTQDSSASAAGVPSIVVNVNIPAGTAVITDRDIPPVVVAAVQQALLKKDRASR